MATLTRNIHRMALINVDKSKIARVSQWIAE